MGKKTRADWAMKFDILQRKAQALEKENTQLRAIREAAVKAIKQMSGTIKDLRGDILERSEILEEILIGYNYLAFDDLTTLDFGEEEAKDVDGD